MTDQYYSNTNNENESKIKIYVQATYYSALCYFHGCGVKQNKDYALSITNNLKDSKAVCNIYQELIEVD
ncbi:9721_t:CDS:1, partial [Racocetra persica]